MLTPETIERFATAYRAQADARLRVESQAADEVRSRLPALGAWLREALGVRRFGYFGSLRTGRLEAGSDVDLFVDRLPKGRYFEVLDRLITALERPVDLVELDRAPESLQAVIAREGTEVDA